MELRGSVSDPYGEAACDTSGYHGCIVQLFSLGDDATPLAKRSALGAGGPDAKALATLVLPDQGGWPRSFTFKGLAPGSYTLIAFVDTTGTGKLDFKQGMQPQGWLAADGGWGCVQFTSKFEPATACG